MLKNLLYSSHDPVKLAESNVKLVSFFYLESRSILALLLAYCSLQAKIWFQLDSNFFALIFFWFDESQKNENEMDLYHVWDAFFRMWT